MSSLVKNFERKGKDLVIELNNGKSYTYKNVPDDVVKNFREAESKGAFLNKVIKKFECEERK